ncbi:hypothetical protein HMPREF3036_01066 [Sutterella sp. KLE1602]|nr:hypothetical protein HMPREF3036_01066 [Sutterella sp. KLE1602]
MHYRLISLDRLLRRRRTSRHAGADVSVLLFSASNAPLKGVSERRSIRSLQNHVP